LHAGNDIGPANDIERGFAIIVVVGGAGFYAIVQGNMSVLISSLNPTASRHKFKKDMVNHVSRCVSQGNEGWACVEGQTYPC
jgi:potassium voltage-gated channel Eag-related subfamily H protein 6